MKYLCEFLKKIMCIGMSSSILLSAVLSIAPGSTMHAHSFDDASTQIFAFELENALVNDIINKDIAGFSSKISNIFQGLTVTGITTSKNEQIVQYVNSNLLSLNFNTFLARRNNNNITITYNATVEVSGGMGPISVNIVSVWEKFKRKGELVTGRSFRERHPFHHCHNETPKENTDKTDNVVEIWLLISQTAIPQLPNASTPALATEPPPVTGSENASDPIPTPVPETPPVTDPENAADPIPTIVPEAPPVTGTEDASDPIPTLVPEAPPATALESIEESIPLVAEPTETTVPERAQTTLTEPMPTTLPEPIQTTLPEPTPTSVPESMPTTLPEPTPTTLPEPIQTTLPEPTPATVPEPMPTTLPELTPTSVPEPIQTTLPEPMPTTLPEPTPTSVPEPIQTTLPEPTPTIVPEPPPTTVPEQVIESTPASVPEPVLAESTPAVVSEPAPVESTMEPNPQQES